MERTGRKGSSARPRPQRRIDADAPALHPRNRHRGHYDFDTLIAANPALAPFVRPSPRGTPTVDFADAAAVRQLNRALLASQYGVCDWQLPDGWLCPPVPGRADYLHGLADLLAGDNGGAIPRGSAVRALDIGTGASCIYPLLGRAEYGWRFVGSDIHADALTIAGRNVAANPHPAAAIELRLQRARDAVLAGIIDSDERFDLVLCNPPFHGSAREAVDGSQRKWRNLGRAGRTGSTGSTRQPPHLNFGGRAAELWCPGGEAGFIRRMIEESTGIREQVLWFSSLVAKSTHLKAIQQQLPDCAAAAVRVVPMAQGSKQSRFVAWSFLDDARRADWSRARKDA